MKKIDLLFLFCVGLIFLPSCAAAPSFSFNGINIPPEARTIGVQTFFADVPAGPANLASDFTERLRSYYRRNTRLSVINENGDLAVEGAIVGYEVTPIAPTNTGNQTGLTQVATLQRLTITVKVTFINSLNNEADFEDNFSFYADFPNEKNLSEVENQLITTIFDQIILNIFNKTVADW